MWREPDDSLAWRKSVSRFAYNGLYTTLVYGSQDSERTRWLQLSQNQLASVSVISQCKSFSIKRRQGRLAQHSWMCTLQSLTLSLSPYYALVLPEGFYLWAVMSVECFYEEHSTLVAMNFTRLNLVLAFRNIMEEDKKKRLMVSVWHKDSQKK